MLLREMQLEMKIEEVRIILMIREKKKYLSDSDEDRRKRWKRWMINDGCWY